MPKMMIFMNGYKNTIMISENINSLRHTSPNGRVSGYGASHLRPNPRFARTSDTRQTLATEIKYGKYSKKKRCDKKRSVNIDLISINNLMSSISRYDSLYMQRMRDEYSHSGHSFIKPSHNRFLRTTVIRAFSLGKV